jgi:hypothetical protein
VVIGDMRRAHHLGQAGVRGARAVLLLSSESTVNLEAALQIGDQWQELPIDPDLAAVLSDNLRRLGLEVNRIESTPQAAKLVP